MEKVSIINKALFIQIHETMKCVQCGFYAQGDKSQRQQTPHAKKKELCSVVTCMEHKAPCAFFEHLQICAKHKRQLHRWQARKMPESRKPLLVMNGELHQNPDYADRICKNKKNASAAKITYEIACYVREQLREGLKTQIQLSVELNVHYSTISNIYNNRVWRDELWG
jgi:hypothetical protein